MAADCIRLSEIEVLQFPDKLIILKFCNLKLHCYSQVTLNNGEKRTITFALLVVAAGAGTADIGRLVGIGKEAGLLGVPIPIEAR